MTDRRSKVADAPRDGTTYGRKNGQWKAVSVDANNDFIATTNDGTEIPAISIAPPGGVTGIDGSATALTEFTDNSGTWVDVTGADMSFAGCDAGDNYLVFVSANVTINAGSDVVTAACTNSTGVQYSGSQLNAYTTGGYAEDATEGNQYQYWTVVQNIDTTEKIKLRVHSNTVSTTAAVNGVRMSMINITKLFPNHSYQQTTHDPVHDANTASWEAVESASITATGDYMIFTMGHMTRSTGNTSFQGRVTDGTTSRIIQGGWTSNTGDHIPTGMTVWESLGVSTLQFQVWNLGGPVTEEYDYTQLLVLPLSDLEEYYVSYTAAGLTEATPPVEETLSSLSFTTNDLYTDVDSRDWYFMCSSALDTGGIVDTGIEHVEMTHGATTVNPAVWSESPSYNPYQNLISGSVLNTILHPLSAYTINDGTAVTAYHYWTGDGAGGANTRSERSMIAFPLRYSEPDTLTFSDDSVNTAFEGDEIVFSPVDFAGVLGEFRFIDTGNTDYASFLHNGTNLVTSFLNTTDWIINVPSGGAVVIDAEANAASTLQVGADTTTYGDSALGTISLYGENTATVYNSTIVQAGATLQFNQVSSTGVEWTGDGDWNFTLRDGGQLVLNDSTDSDSVAWQHDGTNLNATYTNTTYHDLIGLGTAFRIRDGAALYVYDTTDADYVSIAHDGTDANISTPSGDGSINLIHEGSKRLSTEASGEVNLWGTGTGNTTVRRLNFVRSDGTEDGYIGWNAEAHPSVSSTVTNSSFRVYPGPGTGGLIVYNNTVSTDYIKIHHDGTDINWNHGGARYWNIKDLTGGYVRYFDGIGTLWYNSTETDYVAMQHDGTDFNVIALNTAAFNMYDGMTFKIWDSTDTDNAAFDHDGTDFNLTFTTTTDWNITGASAIRFENFVINPTATTVTVRDGDSFRVADSANTSYINLAHDGTDFNTTFASTTDWNIDGADATNVNFVDTKVLFSNGSNNFYGVMTDSLSMASTDGWCNILSCAAGNGRGGGTLMISHSGGSGAPDVMEVKIPTSWDAETPSAMILKNSAGSGVSKLRLGYNSADSSASIDVQVSQATAQTYKLIWRPYQVSTAWDLTPSTTGSTVTSSREITTDDGHMWSLYGGSADTESLWFHPATGFRIGDGGQTDYVQFDHDGTDFNISGTNTTQINVDTSTKFTLASSGSSNSVEIRSTVPAIWMYDDGQATDESAYKMYINAGDFMLRATSDAGSSTGQVLQLVRGTGAVVDYAQWHVPTKQESYVLVKERAAAGTDVAGYGQLWVKNTTPCQLWFTDDAGTDTQIV